MLMTVKSCGCPSCLLAFSRVHNPLRSHAPEWSAGRRPFGPDY
jgi:hypothetical protein